MAPFLTLDCRLPYRGHVIPTLGRRLQPRLPDGQEKRCTGQVVIPPALSDSHASLTLRQSATLRGRAPTGLTHRLPPRRLSVAECARSRVVQTPGGMKLAERGPAGAFEQKPTVLKLLLV